MGARTGAWGSEAMTNSDLSGKRVVVVGGTSGIGFAVAKAALESGANVFVASSGAGNVEAAVARLGAGADGAAMNVRDEASVAAVFERLGGLDHLVYTAGDWTALRTPRSIPELDLAEAGSVFAIRFWGALTAIKYASRIIAKDGSITLTDGVVARRPRKGAVLSTAMAGAVEHLTQALAVDLAPIRVNAVCPGLVVTEVWNSIPEDQREAYLKDMTKHQPLPRAADPAEVAQAYLYLMRGGFTTGQVLVADGGRTLV
jgi:NAD(P)-dependent dehydrogenase (short-subunit alcohol dehydrogenase family)